MTNDISIFDAIFFVSNNRSEPLHVSVQWLSDQIMSRNLSLLGFRHNGVRDTELRGWNLKDVEYSFQIVKTNVRDGEMSHPILRAGVDFDDLQDLLAGPARNVGAPRKWPWPTIVAEAASKHYYEAEIDIEVLIASISDIAERLTKKRPARSTAQQYAHAIKDAWARLG